jgi:hypothetical protein
MKESGKKIGKRCEVRVFKSMNCFPDYSLESKDGPDSVDCDVHATTGGTNIVSADRSAAFAADLIRKIRQIAQAAGTNKIASFSTPNAMAREEKVDDFICVAFDWQLYKRSSSLGNGDVRVAGVGPCG